MVRRKAMFFFGLFFNLFPCIGCNELIFHPLIDWWRKGPITKQLRTFFWSDAPVHYKISMSAYMFSYYGIAASALLSILNYLLLGLAFEVDGFYMHSFEIWLACTVVFPCAGNVAYTLLEYRLGQRDIFSSLIENVTYIPFLWVLYMVYIIRTVFAESVICDFYQLVLLRRSQCTSVYRNSCAYVLIQHHLGCYQKSELPFFWM